MKVKGFAFLYLIRKNQTKKVTQQSLILPVQVLCAGKMVISDDDILLNQKQKLRQIYLFPGAEFIIENCRIQVSEQHFESWIMGEQNKITFKNSVFWDCSDFAQFEKCKKLKIADCQVWNAWDGFLNVEVADDGRVGIERSIFCNEQIPKYIQDNRPKYRLGVTVNIYGKGKKIFRNNLVKESVSYRHDNKSGHFLKLDKSNCWFMQCSKVAGKR